VYPWYWTTSARGAAAGNWIKNSFRKARQLDNWKNAHYEFPGIGIFIGADVFSLINDNNNLYKAIAIPDMRDNRVTLIASTRSRANLYFTHLNVISDVCMWIGHTSNSYTTKSLEDVVEARSSEALCSRVELKQ
jgi:hypothetical protein